MLDLIMMNESAATSVDRERGFTLLEGAAYRFEEPDLLFTVLRGAQPYETIDTLCSATARWAASKPYYLSLTDLREAGTPTPAVRKRGAEALRAARLYGTAFIGGSPTIRAISAMIFRGLALLSARARAAPVRFFATELEARAWLAERRAQLQREAASGKSEG